MFFDTPYLLSLIIISLKVNCKEEYATIKITTTIIPTIYVFKGCGMRGGLYSKFEPFENDYNNTKNWNSYHFFKIIEGSMQIHSNIAISTIMVLEDYDYKYKFFFL